MAPFLVICLLLIGAKWAAQMGLDHLNQRHVRAHAGEVPPAFKDAITPETYAKSVDYTLAKSRFHRVEITWEAVVLIALLFSGVLPWFYGAFTRASGSSIWAGAAFLFLTGILLTLLELPLAWCAQFRLEERFGFNTTRQGTWWSDRLKGLLLGLVLGYPLLLLILKLVQAAGPAWWLWAWACFVSFQLVMLLLAPVLILPLFNKFTPLPAGSLREQLLSLGERAGFRAQDIQVMDGSKRSRHSNAFFTGFGRFRKIVLFDTLIQQLTALELESVLAHEIGHYKKKHIPKVLAWSMGGWLLAFYILSVLARTPWFYGSFGFATGNLFASGNIVPVFLLFTLLAGIVTFWISPLAHQFSRRHEYEADAYAAFLMKEVRSLCGALRKLNEKNLSNLTPHPLYSGFYYSHPTLLEREEALDRLQR
ncbi:MAG TPA: M48 family metallopeptidase [Candidatus Saccharimonadales bacterium]|nr:M48 family metallopeptidase [Candidatus Saccharimonadales bacterium]